MLKGSCLIGQSGGPTSVINASLKGLIDEASKHSCITNIYGTLHGISGILHKQIIDLTKEDKETLDLLMSTNGAALGSVRYKLPSATDNPKIYQKILTIFKTYDIRFFFYIGGNDSMDTCVKIDEYFKLHNYSCHVIGVPKTIDNDLSGTNSSPGFGSCAKYIANAVASIGMDLASYEVGKVTIVEVMGRDVGWLTASSKLACLTNNGPDYIYVPEVSFNIKQFFNDVLTTYRLKKRALIVVSEGIKDENGNYLLDVTTHTDQFGHLQLGGISQHLATVVKEKLNLPVRAIELNLPQRTMVQLIAAADRDFAYQAGVFAVKTALTKTGYMVCQNPDLTLGLIEVNQVANKIRYMPLIYINEQHNHINDSYLDYLKPLIKGQIMVPLKHEIPQFCILKKEIVIK